jgi:hypothetical protein
MGHNMGRQFALVSIVLATALLSLPQVAVRATPGTTTTSTTQPLGSPITNSLLSYLRTRQDTVSIAIHNNRTNQTWSFNPSNHYHASSVAKVNLMAAFLYKLQASKQNMSLIDKTKMSDMIIYSNNVNADYFYIKVGDCAGLGLFNALIPMTSTAPGCMYKHITGWGTTNTTVLDQLSLLELFTKPNAILTDASRSFGLSLLTHISQADSWGVSVGPTPGTKVAFKNGWSPLDSYQNWEINSVGWIQGNHRDYEIAILTSHNPNFSYGVATANTIAQSIWNTMGAPRFYPPVTSTTVVKTQVQK